MTDLNQMQDEGIEEIEEILDAEEVEVEVDGIETEETIDEAKASFGDPSEVPEPSTKQTSLPKTKAGMIAAMADAMKGKKKDELTAAYEKMMKAMNPETDDETDDEVKEETIISVKEVKKLSKDDIDVSEDVAAIFGEEELSEEFKENATTIFEAAVLSKVNEILETVSIDFEADLEAEKEGIVEDLTTKLDDYLEYVAEEWMKDNELAVEQGIRTEIVENFMTGLRDLFTENYIDIPEEKADLVDEMAEKLTEIESSLSEEMDRNIELKKEIVGLKRSNVFETVSESLTQTQAEKFASLAEGVDFEDEESFKNKLETIKENYFPTEEVIESNDTDEEPLDESVITEEATTNGSMAGYMNAISRSIKK